MLGRIAKVDNQAWGLNMHEEQQCDAFWSPDTNLDYILESLQYAKLCKIIFVKLFQE